MEQTAGKHIYHPLSVLFGSQNACYGCDTKKELKILQHLAFNPMLETVKFRHDRSDSGLVENVLKTVGD